MEKKILWKDIFKSVSKSKGRFLSIMGLMFLGSFALVGLKVTGPNMRATGEAYLNRLNVADITVISELGLDDDDKKVLDRAKGISGIEYGYLKDVVIKDTVDSFRIFSASDKISDYQIIDGKMPETSDEIVIDEKYAQDYRIGDTLEFTEQKDVSGNNTLRKHKFEIVGHIYSGEIVSGVNLGQSTTGTGSLKGYAVVLEDVFESDFYMLARIVFSDTENIDPYSDEYTNKIQAHKSNLSELLKGQPNIRLVSVKKDYQEKIDDGQEKLDDAKKELADAKIKLDDAKQQLEDGKNEIQENQQDFDKQVSDAEGKIQDGETQMGDAIIAIAEATEKLDDAKKQLDSGYVTLTSKWNLLQSAKQQLDDAKSGLIEANKQLQAALSAINDGKQQISSATQQIKDNQEKLDEAEQQINDGEQTLAEKQQEYDAKNNEYQTALQEFNQKKSSYEDGLAQVQAGQSELDSKRQQLEQGKVQYEQGIMELQQAIGELQIKLQDIGLTAEETQQIQMQLDGVIQNLGIIQADYQAFTNNTYTPGLAEITVKQNELDIKKQTLEQVKTQLDAVQTQLDASKSQLDDGAAQIVAGRKQLDVKKNELATGKNQLAHAKDTLSKNKTLLKEKEAEYQSGLQQYNTGVKSYDSNLNQYYIGLEEWQQGATTLDEKSVEYQENASKLQQAKKELAGKQIELENAKKELSTKKTDGEKKLADARETLAEKELEYIEKDEEFQEKKPDAEDEIRENETKLFDAKEMLNHLKAPVYSLNSRREIPGGVGNKMYSSVSQIIDALANVFPIFLYFVAALVTFTTMARFVDEERINTGTLKALGYDNEDVMKKFTFYGLISSLAGAILGIVLGHTLLPMIVYNAYHTGFTLPRMELHIHWGITIIALLLAIASAVLPAWLVAGKELKERPSKLLIAKPPVAGSKILLERIKPIWNQMSFTHKVTARNIFRYKKRMLMTIFGVAGAVSLLFAGFGVQHSVGGINERQFGDIIHYDMIVAENDYVTNEQQDEIDNLLASNAIAKKEQIYYEEMTKVAGANKDTQEIKLIVPKNIDEFSNYIELNKRKSSEAIELPKDGVIISERLASLLKVKEGDMISLNDSSAKEQEMMVSGIAEMYMGHFVFASQESYTKIFDQEFQGNAFLVNLKDRTIENTERQAAKFVDLTGVKGVVQNIILTTQIDTIVNSLDKIMKVLIVVAVLLGIVILYNLTNINVSERIRELSTVKVLGFYEKEVTLYIYRETVLLTILGILTGFGIGGLLHQYIITVVPPDEIMFNPAVAIKCFLIPIIITTLVTVVLGFVVNRRLKNVDMLEALKSVD